MISNKCTQCITTVTIIKVENTSIIFQNSEEFISRQLPGECKAKRGKKKVFLESQLVHFERCVMDPMMLGQ